MPSAPIRVAATLNPDGSVTLTIPSNLVSAGTLGSAERAGGEVHAQVARATGGVLVSFGDEHFARAMEAAEWVNVRYANAMKALADA